MIDHTKHVYTGLNTDFTNGTVPGLKGFTNDISNFKFQISNLLIKIVDPVDNNYVTWLNIHNIHIKI